MTGLEGARTFLEALVGYTDQPASGPTPSEDRPPRIGTVDASYSGTGPAKVLFDGETVAGTRLYVVMTPVAASDRVVLIPVGTSYVILGKLGIGAWYSTLTALGTGYRLNQVVTFAASGTFSKATYPWLRAIRVKVQGAGGAGGGAAATGSGQLSVGTGGGAGGYAESFITDIAGLATNVTVTRGTGGTAVSGGGGNAGGSSSFGTAVVATGGAGGNTKPANTFAPYVAAGAGGAGSAGDIRLAGSAGGMAAGANDLGAGGTGGGSQLGGGGAGGASGSTGNPGAAGGLYGGGGGGAMNSGSQSARSGGAGANGIVIVELYA